MFTYIKMSAEEFNKKISGGQVFSIVVPNDAFEESLLKKVLIDELHLMFSGEEEDDYDKFDLLCSYIWYDEKGRFFFDLSEYPVYTTDKLSFYVNVFKSEMFEDISEEYDDLVLYEESEDATVDYEFYVYSHNQGVMSIELDEAIKIMMKNSIQKI